MKKRYFIVFFQGWKGSLQKTGETAISCNGFFNPRMFLSHLNQNENLFDRIVITGFNEVSEEDYQTWTQI